jgi:hypothetical protein
VMGSVSATIVRMLVQRLLISLPVLTLARPQINPQATSSASIFWNVCSSHQLAFRPALGLGLCGRTRMGTRSDPTTDSSCPYRGVSSQSGSRP